MDAKITLSFDAHVIQNAKLFADKNNISLSRLTEFVLRKITTGHYTSLDNLPVSDWVNMVAEGEAEYKTKSKSRKSLKEEFYSSNNRLSMVAEDQAEYKKIKSSKNSKYHSSKKK